MARTPERLARSARLQRSKDFQRVGRQGTRVASRNFVLLVAPSLRESAPELRARLGSESGSRSGSESGGEPVAEAGAEALPSRRLGVTASRKVGRAVARNRVKRGIREWFRHYRDDFAPSVDIVVIARHGASRLTAEKISEDLRELAQRL